jgi:hypothetical protein
MFTDRDVAFTDHTLIVAKAMNPPLCEVPHLGPVVKVPTGRTR